VKHFLLALGIWMILSACVEERSHEQHRMDKWIGRSKDDLLRKWGLPENAVRNSDGSEVLVYAREVYQFEHTALGLPRLAQLPHFVGYHYKIFHTDSKGIIRWWETNDQDPAPDDVFGRPEPPN
jgi:hypothetical protein